MSQSPLKWTDSPTGRLGKQIEMVQTMSQSPLKWTDSPTMMGQLMQVVPLRLSQSPLKWTDSPTKAKDKVGTVINVAVPA